MTMTYLDRQVDATIDAHLRSEKLYAHGIPSIKGRALFVVGLDRMLHLAHLEQDLYLICGDAVSDFLKEIEE